MTIAVLGAGLLGSGVALSLAARGNRVVLYDRREAPMMEASRWCEGKVHLGHVYCGDPSARTGLTAIVPIRGNVTSALPARISSSVSSRRST